MKKRRTRALFLSVVALTWLWSASVSAQELDLEDHSACSYPDGFPKLPEADWRHSRSELIADVGEPWHFARDAVTVTNSGVELQAKFTYGDVSKDMEDEKVRVLLQTCDGWQKLGEALTDDDGWMQLDYTGALEPGVYRVLFQQVADGTYATSKLWVVPKGTKVAIFDIDGTLTTGDEEIFAEVTDDIVDVGDYVPEAYPGGKEISKYYAQRGYLLVYLTGRPYWLAQHSRNWLVDEGMADGVLRLTTTHSDSWPSDSAVGEFKLAELRLLQAAGLSVDVAHGNATTDISAYIGAGVPKEQIWIIGPHAGEQGTQKVKKGWDATLDALQSQQPTADR
ncbi:hypothetical protein FIV42_06095 [Persicimonas caeni]|uniref:LNS2/PITP domain-containing protein n=1 Tax=Persicimonas caeni TaxID=2292766 RepID=A0A4Y6PPS5_PERCE|nr:hypothetical protein [Persicimonas caeni]QDG50318.1 hypothetical protein FIV42_06095 [Persicimonas caeni]QED31539.1 hypothetical protein FRD00_06090 [Persicimonas caeni]